MKQDIRSKLRENRDRDAREHIDSIVKELEAEGYSVEFGSIGQRTTYAYLSRGDEEILGYTFIRDLKYKNEVTGQLKALQQALVRKEQEVSRRAQQ